MVLDSSAVVAIFKGEPGFEALQQKIDRADVILIGAPTLVEVGIVLARQTGRSQMVTLAAYLRRIDAEVIPFTESHYAVAMEAFVRFGRGFNSQAALNFGDCLSYAIAREAGQPLLFVGNDFPFTDLASA